jgi:hypothetical protein
MEALPTQDSPQTKKIVVLGSLNYDVFLKLSKYLHFKNS